MKKALFGILVSLITASLLWASEEAYDGAGLQWVVGWCLAGLIYATANIESAFQRSATKELDNNGQTNKRRTAVSQDAGITNDQAAPLRWHWMDTGWLAIVAGQWISACRVFLLGGDRRTALNLSLEWLGLLIAWWLLREAMRQEYYRRLLGTLVVGVITGIAAFGLWQHHVVYHQQAQWYRTLRGELDELLAKNDPRYALAIAEKTSELQRNGIALTGTDRFLWEQRLLNSSEPTGTFALANSLGGLLGVALVVVSGSLVRWLRGHLRIGIMQLTLTVLILAVILYCLILTKSRTAWVATIFGLGILCVQQFRSINVSRRLGMGIASGMLGVLALSGFAVSTGALDKEVLLEAPRSLQFRLLYWMGTVDALKESPVFGFGPGNFRQSYLTHKLPESSEEIRDPHNMPLEAWASGGIISLFGVLLCWAGWLKGLAIDPPVRNPRIAAPVTSRRGRKSNGDAMALVKGCAIGFSLYAAWQWLNGSDLSMALDGFLLVPTFSLLVCFCFTEPYFQLTPSIGTAAAAVLLIHLLGAGGFQITGVMLILSISLSAAINNKVPERLPTQPKSGLSDQAIITSRTDAQQPCGKTTAIVASVFCLLALATTFKLGLLPVFASGGFMNEAKNYQLSGNLRAALTSLQKATEADPLAVIPRQRIAELQSYRLLDQVRQSDVRNGSTTPDSSLVQLVTQAMDACEQLIEADSGSIVGWRTRAAVQMANFEVTRDPEILLSAVRDQQKALTMYPTSVVDWWTLYQMTVPSTLPALQEIATQAARQALVLDTINREWGHADRYLTELQISTLKQTHFEKPGSRKEP